MSANLSSRPLNPDTGLPMPSPSVEQLALVAELLDQASAAADAGGNLSAEALTAVLTGAVVRQHGRTLRACLTELREHARDLADDLVTGSANTALQAAIDTLVGALAHRTAVEADALRGLMLRGDRA